jgi:ATP-dependent exoDNAse (exonuclease V) beta subunit
MREKEERKRVFYVACTRARRELHLFGTATTTASGELRPGAADSLLASAWPALGDDFFAAHQAQTRADVIPFPHAAQPGVLDLAAAAGTTHPLLVMRRLAEDIEIRPFGENVTVADTFTGVPQERELFERPEGSRIQRVTGSIIHVLLERLSRHLADHPEASAGEIHQLLQPMAKAMLRTAALSPDRAAAVLSDILNATEAAAADTVGRWLLHPRTGALSEASWTGWLEGRLRTIRADRVFRAGAHAQDTGTEYFWVVDYKTSPYSGGDVTGFLAAQRKVYEPQLELYAAALRKLHGDEIKLRLGLYFPRLGRLEFWAG